METDIAGRALRAPNFNHERKVGRVTLCAPPKHSKLEFTLQRVTRHLPPVTLVGREPLQTDVGKIHRSKD